MQRCSLGEFHNKVTQWLSKLICVSHFLTVGELLPKLLRVGRGIEISLYPKDGSREGKK